MDHAPKAQLRDGVCVQLRWYQEEAVDAVVRAWKRGVRKPLACLPTGSGKSAVISVLAQKFRKWYPDQNIITTVHTKELVAQLAETYEKIAKEKPGIYSASLGIKDARKATFAQVQSIYKKQFKNNIGLVNIDECDRCPTKGEGQYRTFIAGIESASSHCRFAGFTATPYRLGTGVVYGEDQPWNELVYDADIRTLIEQGYLSELVSKDGGRPNLTGVRTTGGDYNREDIDAVMSEDGLLDRAVEEIAKYRPGRKGALYFSPGIKHAYLLEKRLYLAGIRAPVVHSDLPSGERDALISQYKAGILNDLININILTIGFDAPRIDLIVDMGPTKSPGRYYQKLGRGLRICEEKKNCLVLDLSGNIEFHGPIDTLNKRQYGKRKATVTMPGEAPKKECPECKAIVHASARVCPECNHEFPEKIVNHADEATEMAPLSGILVGHVTDVRYSLTPGKDDKPNTVRVTYSLRNMKDVSIWLCCDNNHSQFLYDKFCKWLKCQQFVDGERTLRPGPVCKIATLSVSNPTTARDWLPWLRSCVASPTKITFKDDGSRFCDIMRYEHG